MVVSTTKEASVKKEVIEFVVRGVSGVFMIAFENDEVVHWLYGIESIIPEYLPVEETNKAHKILEAARSAYKQQKNFTHA